MSLCILYGTQSGTAERLAFRVARMAVTRGLREVRCLPADDVSVDEWPSLCAGGSGHLLLLLANANQGEAPESYRRSWARLLQPDAPSMSALSYAVFGLGDSLYAKFNYMAKMTHNRLKQLGGQPLLPRGLGDESDAKGIDETLLPWLGQLWTLLGVQASNASSEGGHLSADPTVQDPLDASVFPLHQVILSSASDSALAGSSSTLAGGAAPPRREETFKASVTSNRRLTAQDHFQAVHFLELDVATSASYEVGDALGVYCPNRPEAVADILQRFGLQPDQVLTVRPRTDSGIVQHTTRQYWNRPMTAEFLFTHYVDLEAVVEQDFFWMLSSCVERISTHGGAGSQPANSTAADDEDPVEEIRSRLLELANPLQVDGFLEYSHREKRNVCEVLFDFNMAHGVRVLPSLDLLLTFLTPMRPRLFSLSSSPALDALPRVGVTVAQLAWQTPMKRSRTGLCSTALVEATVGQTFQTFFWEGTLTPPPTPSPLLLIATGTGIAPIRALIRHCAASSDKGWENTPIYLVFGCRNAAKDFLFEDEWRLLKDSGRLHGLTVIPAFSRDTPGKKVYVQHQLGQHAKLVATLLAPEDGGAPALTYLCGNAKNMPRDVQSTLESAVAAVRFEGNAAEAEQLVKQLQRGGRYQVDTWSA